MVSLLNNIIEENKFIFFISIIEFSFWFIWICIFKLTSNILSDVNILLLSTLINLIWEDISKSLLYELIINFIKLNSSS